MSDDAYEVLWNENAKRVQDLANKHNVRLVSFIHGELEATGKPEDVEAFAAAVLNRAEFS